LQIVIRTIYFYIDYNNSYFIKYRRQLEAELSPLLFCSKSTVEASGEVEGGKTTDVHVGKPSDTSHLPQPASLNLRRLSVIISSKAIHII